MFNVGGPEIVLVILVALVVLGPEQLPKAMRTFGNVMGEVRKLSSGFQSEMRDAMNAAELDASATSDSSKSTASTGSSGASASDGVEEVVARNDGPGPSPGPPGSSSKLNSNSAPGPADGGPDTGTGGPSAADRAAG